MSQVLTELGPGLAQFASPTLVAVLIGGVTLGLVVGAIPGLTATLAIALLLPFTFRLEAVEALVMLTGIYVGGIYGGSITAITLRIPGAPANMMTVADGFAMTQQGRPEVALGLATFSSFVGGIVGGVVLVLFAPQLARITLAFQSPEMFSLVLLALVTVATVTQGSLVKSLVATLLGLMLSTIGLDRMMPVPRFTFGVTNLLVGIPLLPMVVGVFALSELFWQVGQPDGTDTESSARTAVEIRSHPRFLAGGQTSRLAAFRQERDHRRPGWHVAWRRRIHGSVPSLRRGPAKLG